VRQSRTLYDKLIDRHAVQAFDAEDRSLLLYVDRTVLNEYTSPQAFTGLRQARRPVWRPDAALGVVDHVNPTAPDRTRRMAAPGVRPRSTISKTTAGPSESNSMTSCIRFRGSSTS
jgi:3-isopropylmalate/(R)-2-methylmalate dehydratase large subunit